MSEERVPLPGGWSRERIDADLKANADERERIRTAPATPEERAAQEAYFAALKARQAGASVVMTERQKRVALARHHLDIATDMLDALSPDDPGFPAEDRRLRLVVAIQLGILGSFEDALDICPEEETPYRERWAELLAAELRDDDDMCACEGTATTLDHPATGVTCAVTIPAHKIEGDFPSTRRHLWVWAIRCTVCGALNLRRELTPSAAAVLNARDDRPDAEAMA
jgi:hypothetical protein